MTKSHKVTALKISVPEEAFDPRDPIARQCHPIYQDKYILPTDSINELAQQVALWLRKGVTGGIVTAKSDYGKTRAIRYIQKVRSDLFGPRTAVVNFPMVELPERKHSLWQYLADRLGFGPIRSRACELDVLGKCVKGLHWQAERVNAKRIVVFLDDAQFLRKEDYAALKPVYDAMLNEFEKRLLVVSIGEERLLNTRTDMLKNGMTAVNRFLRATATFEGLTSTARIRKVLRAYDEILTYPVGSNVSFTESLCPRAFGAEFRVASLASRVEQMYSTLVIKSAVGDGHVMTMKILTGFVNSLLDTLADIDSAKLEVDDDLLKESLSDAIQLWSG